MSTLTLLRAALGLCLFGFIYVLSYTIGAVPSRAPSYLGFRGMKRVRALNESEVFARSEPLIRWLGARLDPLLSDSLRDRLDRILKAAGDYLGLVPQEVAALCVLGTAIGTALGMLYSTLLDKGFFYVIIAAAFCGAFPYIHVTGIENDRKKSIQRALPWAVDLIALGLSAGLDFPGAMRQVVDKSATPDAPLIEELNSILQELQVGKTRKQALLQFSERVPTEVVREFVGTIVQAEERGNPLSEVLRVQAEASRQRRGVRAEEIASKTSVKLVLPMTLLLFAVMILIVAPLGMEFTGNLPGK